MTLKARYFGSVVLIAAALAFIPLLGRAQDTDGDGMPNSFEVLHWCLNPSVPDDNVDYDSDGLTSLQEYQYFQVNPYEGSLDPCDPDTDGDGVDDGTEYAAGSDPAWDLITPGLARVGGSDQRITYTDTYPELPSVTWDGSEFGLSWDDGDWSPYYQPSWTALTGDGDTVGPNHRVGTSSADSWFTDIAGTGSEFVIVWQEDLVAGTEVYFNRTDLAGDTLGVDLAASASGSGAYRPKIAWSGSEFGVAWHDYRDGNTEIYFRRIAANGSLIGGDVRVTNDNRSSTDPAMVWTGSEYSLAWIDFRDLNYEVYFTRVAPDGTPLGVDTRVTYGSQYESLVDLAWTGSEYGLAALYGGEPGDVEFVRLAADGSTIGSFQDLTSLGAAYYPSLAWNGSEFGVVWEDYRDVYIEVYLQRIAADGSLIGIELPVSPTTDNGDAFTATITASSLGEYGIGFMDTRNGAGDSYDIYFALVGYDSDGDGLSDVREPIYATSANDYDSDDDGLPDGFEVYYYGTNPALADSDGDGIDDPDELFTYGTDPMLADTDGDGLTDYQEIIVYGTDPLLTDTDDDLMPDPYEVVHLCLGATTDDAAGDPDSDTLSNLYEYNQGTDPCDDDSDDDASNDNVDCDPLDPNNWVSCATCVDQDGDVWLVGCDAYVTINGPDCDDSVVTGSGCHNTCSNFYADTDSDLHGDPLAILNRCVAPVGYVANNTDCSDTDQNAWDTCATCNDDDSDTYYELCNQYVGIAGPDCSDTDQNAWDTCATCNDDDSDTYFELCNQYVGINGPDCSDTDQNAWNTCATCNDGDSDTYFEL